MSIAVIVSASLLVGASAQFPFLGAILNPLDIMGSTRQNVFSDKFDSFGQAAEEEQYIQCETDESFFDKGLKYHVVNHPEWHGTGAKLSLRQKRAFFAVDVPWSSEANQISFAERDGWWGNDAAETTPEDPAAALAAKRRAIREKKAWNGDSLAAIYNAKQADKAGQERKLEEARNIELSKERAAGMKARTDKFENVDVYYVNMNKAVERRDCLEKQFASMSNQVTLKRFPAIEFPDCRGKGMGNLADCLRKEGFGDCIEAGIDKDATRTHASRDSHDDSAVRMAVLSNWCSHKRLWQQIERDSQKPGAAKFHMVLEDDVIVDRQWFMPIIQDFATNYENKDWDLVQVDPFGSKSKRDLLGRFRGKPIFKPAADGQCSAYWGFHSVLVKNSALPRINHWMSTNKALPIDWLPFRMPHCLAFSALVARNPEATIKGNTVVLPKYCSARVQDSTIAQR